MGTPKEETITRDFADAVAKGKRERQAILKRVRQRRALILQRLAAKDVR
jgi:hypothetical protein